MQIGLTWSIRVRHLWFLIEDRDQNTTHRRELDSFNKP